MADSGELLILRGIRNALEVWLASRSLLAWGSASAQGFGGRSSFRFALRLKRKLERPPKLYAKADPPNIQATAGKPHY